MDKAIVEQLRGTLPHDVVKTRAQGGQQLSYIEGWFALQTANEIFGFDGWEMTVISSVVLFSAERNGKYQHVVRTHVRVRVGDVTRDGIGVGIATQTDPAGAIELAEKAAETDAQKRALRTFGNRFGLCLYDKEQEGVGASRAAREHLEAITALTSLEAVNGYAREHTAAFKALGPADQADVRAALDAARARLAPKSAPAAPPSVTATAPAPEASVPGKRDWIKEIASTRTRDDLAALSQSIAAANLNGSRDAVLSALAQRWRKAFAAMRDETSKAALRTFYLQQVPVELRDEIRVDQEHSEAA